MERRPNILFILADDQRFDTIAALGNPAIHTPNLDKLVSRGTAFTRAHVMGGSSPAICMPSRAMVHTGRTLYRIAGQGQTIADDHTLLGQHLRHAGYHTWGCGKWHNGTAAFNRAFADGDAIYFGGMCDHWNVPAYHYDPSGQYDAQTPRCVHPLSTDALQWSPGDAMVAGKHSSELLADATIDFLRGYQADAPFLAYVSLLAPHDPRTMPERFRAMYDPDAIELPPNFAPAHPFDTGELAIRDELLAGFPRGRAEVRRHIADYYAMITHLDHEMGRVLDAIDASGHADDTIVVFAGDNGLAVGRHGLMGKQNLYDHSVRVPLIFAGPRVPAGERRDGLACLIDIYPTLCDVVGLDTPASVEGRSLAPCFADASHAPRDLMHLAYRGVQRGVTDGRFKLIAYHVNGCRRTQLFDLHDDPHELNDLSNDPAHADTRQRLTHALLRWRDELHDNQEGQGATFWADWPDAAKPRR